MQTLDLPALYATYLSKRDRIAHKGDFGHVVASDLMLYLRTLVNDYHATNDARLLFF